MAATVVIAARGRLLLQLPRTARGREKTARYPDEPTGVERPVPPPPRLQTYPFQDIKALRRHDKPLLDRYEWVDRTPAPSGSRSSRAMDLLANVAAVSQAGGPARRPPQRRAAGSGAAAPVPPRGASGASRQRAAHRRLREVRVGGSRRRQSPPKPMPYSGSGLQAPGASGARLRQVGAGLSRAKRSDDAGID